MKEAESADLAPNSPCDDHVGGVGSPYLALKATSDDRGVFRLYINIRLTVKVETKRK
jgi:hypothetical protein